MAFDSVSQAQNLWIKGKSFTIENLLGERYGKEAKDFDGCSVGIFRVQLLFLLSQPDCLARR
jgi:phosphatidylserine decarboxylase